jgi:hypothetical protein
MHGSKDPIVEIDIKESDYETDLRGFVFA